MVEPREAQYLESAYKEEELRLTSTRVWFAPKEGTFVLEQNQILFAPIATRVYAAGSNPIDPRKESVPAESSRRVLNWWDRHFEALADYEPHFHRQNEVMKWSVITGWLREHERLGGLADVAVDSSQRFDRWFKSAPGLRFRDDVRFLPESRWLGETECMERLRSYPFEHVNSVAYIEGGVSLGSTELLAAARRVDSTVPVTLRRGSVNYAKSAAGDLVTFKGTTFHVPSSQSVARAEIAATSRLRQAGSELRLSQLETRVTPGWFSVHSEHGSVAGLRVSNTGRGIKLHTDLGALEQVRQSLISQGRGEGAPLSTVSAKLSVEPRTYVIEGAEGRQMLKAVTTADGHDAWVHVQEAAEVGRREGLWVPGDQRGGKLLQTVGQHTAEAKLAEQRWLRVSPQEGSEVGYTFTQQGPSEGSRSVLLKTDSPALRSVEGKLGSDGQLYLQRPSNLPPEGQRAFNNLGRSEQLTAAELRALDKTRGDGPVVLEPLSARRSLPEQVQTWAERGDVAQIKRAIADRVRQGRGAEALDLLKRLNKESLNAGAGDLLTLSQSRSRAVSKILAAHGGPPAPGLSKLRVATMGRRSLAAAELAREARSYVADGKDLPELAGQGSTVVMFQRQLLNQGSLYENPAGYLASVSRNPRVVVTEVRPGQLGSFTPDMVVVQEKEFVRQPVSARPTSSSQGGNGYLRWSRSSTPSQPRVLLVEECPDPNHDGQLDSEERQSCLCDLNKDGTLTTEERASCGLPPQ